MKSNMATTPTGVSRAPTSARPLALPAAAWAVPLAVAWLLILALALRGELSDRHAVLLLLVPAVLATLAVIDRRGLRAPLARAAGFTGVTAGAAVAAIWIPHQPALAVAVPGIALSGVFCARFPAAATIGIFAVTGAYGSIDAFTAIHTAGVIDLLLVGLWIGAIWGYLIGGRRRAAWIWPGVVACALFLAITLLQVTTADSLSLGVQAFRETQWYMMAFILVAYAPWPHRSRQRLLQGVVLVALAVGGYACFRLIVGADPQEQTHALTAPGNTVPLADIGLLGSFDNSKSLAGWCAVAIPFLIGFGVVQSGWWRLTSLIATALCTVALFGSGARGPLAAAIIGLAVLFVLYQVARAFPGAHLGATAMMIAGVIAIGTAGYLLTQGVSGEGASRYNALLHPTSEPSFQARLTRWNEALTVIPHHPLGLGLGTVGGAATHFATSRNLETNPNLDSTYLKVALEQGPAVFGLFCAALILLLYGLASRAIATYDRAKAALAIGACAALATMSVLFFIGFYGTGRPALAGWIIVGIGVSQFAFLKRGDSGATSQGSAVR
jgi:hypothetical protein